jgi:ribosomal protein S18 acetylase RimI-like enzyme
MTQRFDYTIRQVAPTDEPFLREMLYHAIYVAKGTSPPPRDIINSPELARYVRDWGRTDEDVGLLAIDAQTQQPVGAAWLRLMTKDDAGYGYVDDDTPELSIAVLPQHRGRGTGTQLLTDLLREAQTRYKAVSLSVSADNPALKMYERAGFEVVTEEGKSVTMRKELRATPHEDVKTSLAI